MLFRIGICLAMCSLCWPANTVAQENFSAMWDSWTKCNKEMTEKFEAIDNGDVSPGLTDEYRDLVDEANKLIKSMRKQGLVELKENPGDGKLIRALLGIMVHDAQAGRDNLVLDVGHALIEARINPKYFEQAAKVGQLELKDKRVFDELVIRHNEAMVDDLPRVKFQTTAGDIVLELYENEAPNTVRNFVSLVESGYYSDKLFHRVIENFMAQGGGFEVEGIGSGGPGYQIDCECRVADARRNFTGTISMAHTGRRDTGGSQFFLNFKHNESLDRKHTVFGRIVSGKNVLERIERTAVAVNDSERPIKQAKPDKIIGAEVIRKRDHSYRVRKKGEPELPEEPEPKKEMPKKETASDEPELEPADEPELEPADDKKTEPEMKEESKEDSKSESKEPSEKTSAEKKSDKMETEEPDSESKEPKSEKEDEDPDSDDDDS